MGKIRNSPLVEAIFELRWGEGSPGHFEFRKEETDFFPGIFSQEIGKLGFDYSKQLNPATEGQPSFPFQVKHQFRKAENSWPCYQIGLGIFTANQLGNKSRITGREDEYDWADFKSTITSGLTTLDASLPEGINGLAGPRAVLRYQDGFSLEKGESIEAFINNKIEADMNVSKLFVGESDISESSSDIGLTFTYNTTRPVGKIVTSIKNALISGELSALIDTTVTSPLQSEDKTVEYLSRWCEEAHDIQLHVFKTLISESTL